MYWQVGTRAHSRKLHPKNSRNQGHVWWRKERKLREGERGPGSVVLFSLFQTTRGSCCFFF